MFGIFLYKGEIQQKIKYDILKNISALEIQMLLSDLPTCMELCFIQNKQHLKLTHAVTRNWVHFEQDLLTVLFAK